MAGRPNIILVCADQQRMDSLACYGNRFIVTPGTSAMAANGMVFDRPSPHGRCARQRAAPCGRGSFRTRMG